MSKCASRKRGRPPELNNTANAGRIVRGRNGRKILPAFLLVIFVAALAIAAIPQEKKERRNHFGADQEMSFVKAVRTIRQENRQGRGKLPPLYAAVRVRRRSCRIRITDPLPGGSQDTGGAFRSRVQRPGVRHRSIGAGRIRPMWLRTDLVQVKRDRHTGRP